MAVGGLKPTSIVEMVPKQGSVTTLATLSEPIARQWLRALRTGRPVSAAAGADLRDEVANIFSRKLGLADHQERWLPSLTRKP